MGEVKGRKVFVSYKYGDTQVQDLNVYEENWFGQDVKVQTKARHYVNELSEILDSEDHIWSLVSYRYLKSIELASFKRSSLKDIKNPIKIVIERITEKLNYFETSLF